MADVGLGRAYIHSGIIPNSTYQITGAVYDKNGGQIHLSQLEVLSGSGTLANGTVSDFVINSNGTYSFVYKSGNVGAGPSNQDHFKISVNDIEVLLFWTNSY